jgi:hypothetical protein
MRQPVLLTAGLALLLVGPLTPTAVVADVNDPIVLTCPADFTVFADPGRCDTHVFYPAPTVTGGNGDVTVTCDPPSGSLMRVGAYPVIKCVATDPSGQTATCSFQVNVRTMAAPSCRFCFYNPNTRECSSQFFLVASSPAGAPLPSDVLILAYPDDECANVVGATRRDGLDLTAPFPIGDTIVTEEVRSGWGNTGQCTGIVTVLPPFVRRAGKVYLRYRVPTLGEPVELSGPAELLLDINFPLIPVDPIRIHAQINLHDVVATLGGVQYHATNNVDAQLTASQLSPIALTVPGRYKFEAHGKAALHSFTLDMPLDVVITGGAFSSAGFRQPQLVSP